MTVRGPEPVHTDACIRDAATYGFCEHTRLYASHHPRAHPSRRAPTRRSATTRAVLSWVGLVLLVGSVYFLARQVGFWVLAYTATFGLGWLLLFVSGLPAALTSDPALWLPPDAAARARKEITGDDS